MTGSSKSVDPCTVEFVLPQPDAEAAATTPISIISELENLRFAPDAAAARLLNPLQSLFALGARVYVGWQFWKSGFIKITTWDSTLAEYADSTASALETVANRNCAGSSKPVSKYRLYCPTDCAQSDAV